MARKVFEWDDPDDENGNVQHIGRHGVTTEEAEQVVRNRNNAIVRSDSSTDPMTLVGQKPASISRWSGLPSGPIPRSSE